jgi:thioredoxin-like negative regulator of GroEL
MNYLTTSQFKEIVFDIGNENEPKKEWGYRGTKPCIILCSASWCSPCRTVTPVLEDLEKDGNFILYKIDVEEEYELSKFFNIRSVPTILFVPVKGQPISHTGAFPKGELKKFIAKYFGE